MTDLLRLGSSMWITAALSSGEAIEGEAILDAVSSRACQPTCSLGVPA
jgi:hypothetical protein